MAELNRIQKNLEVLRDMKEQGGVGTTRLSYTKEYRAAVEYLQDEMRAAGLQVREDGIGTLYGVRPGRKQNAGTIISGSHLDTVQSSGYFDGQAGIVCALEVARMLQEQAIELVHDYEVIVTIMEEGSRFAALFGTEFITGQLVDVDLDQHDDADGVTLREAIVAYGLSGEIADVCRKDANVKAFIEVHLEQGSILDDAKKPLGIVENINGCRWYEVTIDGVGTHASTPNHKRNDASLAAARFISTLETKIVQQHAEDLTLTIGEFAVFPGSKNAVPSKVVFSIDSRTGDKAHFAILDAYLASVTGAMETQYGVEIEVALIPSTDPVAMDTALNAIIEQSITALGYPVLKLNSPGSHDAMILAKIWPTTMLFVPSVAGISHAPEEWTDYENLVKASNVLFDVIRKIDTQ